MIKLSSFSILSIVSLLPVVAQDQVPTAQPVESGNTTLAARPEADSLAIAENIYAQSQTPTVKQNPEEYKQILTQAATLYGQFIEKFPRSAERPKALYRYATCLQELGNNAGCEQILQTIVRESRGPIAGAAAYKLGAIANDRSQWDLAQSYFNITLLQTDNPSLRMDAQFRIARIYMITKNYEKATEAFLEVIASPTSPPAFRQASLASLAQLYTETKEPTKAYDVYKQLLADTTLDTKTRAQILLQAANLASKLNKPEESQVYYKELLSNPEMASQAGEAQLGQLIELYRAKNYKAIIMIMDKGTKPFESKELNARRAQIFGQACLAEKQYDRAIACFTNAEQILPNSDLAMDCAYRRLICAQTLKDKNFENLAKQYLTLYPAIFASSPLHDNVRLMVAEELLHTRPEQAAGWFKLINLENIAEDLRPEVAFKTAWAIAKTGDRITAIARLTDFITNFPQDKRLVDAYILRGDQQAKTGGEAAALLDYATAIKLFPKEAATAIAWQRSAQIYAQRQDTPKLIEFYTGFINNFPKAMPAALSEAHFLIARGLFDQKKIPEAIKHFKEAKTLNPEKFGPQVSLMLVLSYYQEQNAALLEEAIEELAKNSPESLAGIPETVPAWLGMQCFIANNFEKADKYLSMSTKNDQSENVKKLVWKTLAKTRLALGKYEEALRAVEKFILLETQAYWKADGLMDKASILLGLKRPDDAQIAVEQAITLGVEGPLLASLKIIQGDIAFARQDYLEAAKFYGTTAELFVSDKELKPLALYKTVQALQKAGKSDEAKRFETNLKTEFPTWEYKGIQPKP